MNDQRPKTEQPKEQVAPSAAFEPSKTAVPAKPNVAGPQPQRPDSGGASSNTAIPNDPARISTQAKT